VDVMSRFVLSQVQSGCSWGNRTSRYSIALIFTLTVFCSIAVLYNPYVSASKLKMAANDKP
jgi:hypothetical protein